MLPWLLSKFGTFYHQKLHRACVASHLSPEPSAERSRGTLRTQLTALTIQLAPHWKGARCYTWHRFNSLGTFKEMHGIRCHVWVMGDTKDSAFS